MKATEIFNNCKTLTKRQQETIKDNLRAYLANFGYIKIDNGDYYGFYIYTDESRAESGSFTHFCENIDYLNGWLYGAVQAVNKIMKPLESGKIDFELFED